MTDGKVQIFDDKRLSVIAFLHMVEDDVAVALGRGRQVRAPCRGLCCYIRCPQVKRVRRAIATARFMPRAALPIFRA